MELKSMHKLEYFENKEYISNSMLGWLKRSPAYFQACISGDFERKDSLSLERGSLLHLYILEPHKFIVEDIDPVTGMMGTFIKHFVANQTQVITHSTPGEDVVINFDPSNEKHLDLAKGQAYRDSGFKLPFTKVWENFQKPENQMYYNFLKSANGKIAISQSDKYIIDRCYKSVQANPLAFKLLFGENDEMEIHNEYEIYEDDFITPGFKAKAKLDRILINRSQDYAIIVDLKTTAKSVYGDLVQLFTSGHPTIDYYATGFMQSYIQFAYYRQQAYYSEIVKKHFGLSTVVSYIVPVETGGMFECAVYRQSNAFAHDGLKEIQGLIHAYTEHAKTGDWSKPEGWESGYRTLGV